MEHFNCRHCELAYKRVARIAEDKKLSIDHPYITALTHATKSKRILKFIEHAYLLGMARGILMVDEGHNIVKIDPLELPEVQVIEERG